MPSVAKYPELMSRGRANRNRRLARPPFNPETGAAVDADERQRSRQRRRIDARQRAHPLEQRLVERQRLCLGARSGNRRDDDVLRLESRRDVEHMPEAHEQQAGADEQHQRQGELGHDEHGTHTGAARARAPAASFLLQRGRELLIGGRQRGITPNTSPVHGRHDERDGEHPHVHADLCDAGERGEACGGQRAERAEAPRGHEHARGAADDRQQHAFGQQLPDQPRAAGTEGEPDPRLETATGRLGEQQHRHVGARDEQHESDRAEQHEQAGLHVADQRLLQRVQMRRVRRVRLRILIAEALADRVHVGARLVERDARLEPRDDLHRMDRATRIATASAA